MVGGWVGGRTVVGVHAGAKGIENAGHPNLHVALGFIGVHHGFSHALAFVVAGAGADRVDIAPVGLGLGVDLGWVGEVGGWVG